MKGRLSFGFALPQMQRISSSSLSSSSGAGEGWFCADFLLGFPLAPPDADADDDAAPLVGLGCGAGDDEAFLCWPLVARPERRGSSVAMSAGGHSLVS